MASAVILWRWDWLTWTVAGIVLVSFLYVNLCGSRRYDLGAATTLFSHGWPLTFLEREIVYAPELPTTSQLNHAQRWPLQLTNSMRWPVDGAPMSSIHVLSLLVNVTIAMATTVGCGAAIRMSIVGRAIRVSITAMFAVVAFSATMVGLQVRQFDSLSDMADAFIKGTSWAGYEDETMYVDYLAFGIVLIAIGLAWYGWLNAIARWASSRMESDADRNETS